MVYFLWRSLYFAFGHYWCPHNNLLQSVTVFFFFFTNSKACVNTPFHSLKGIYHLNYSLNLQNSLFIVTFSSTINNEEINFHFRFFPLYFHCRETSCFAKTQVQLHELTLSGCISEYLVIIGTVQSAGYHYPLLIQLCLHVWVTLLHDWDFWRKLWF